MEFTCPCGSESRFHFLILLFVMPGIVAIVLMTAFFFQRKCGIKKIVKKFCVCIFPAAVWLTVLFLDGRYYTCIKSDWLGKYVTVNYDVLEKWCEPENGTLYNERLKMSEEWYASSQIYGLYLFGALGILVLIITIIMKVPERNDPENPALQSSTSSPSTSGGNDPENTSPSTNTTPV